MNHRSRSGPKAGKRRGAFTLIELLIVIAVIAIMVTMMMPQVGKMMGEARFIGCMNNMRQVMNASLLFASAHKGSMPSPNWGYDVTQRGWLFCKGKMDKREDLKAGQLWEYLGDPKAYRCPADPEPDESNPSAVLWRPLNSRMITSYSMNGSVIRYGARPKITDPESPGSMIYDTHKVSEFRPDAIMFWEPDERAPLNGWWWDGSNYPWEGVSSNRHGRRAAVATAGGTVDRIDIDDYYRLANSNSFNRVRNSPNALNGIN